MTFEQELILHILSLALKGKKCTNIDDYSIDWNSFINEAIKQGVLALLFYNMDKSLIKEDIRDKFDKLVVKELVSIFQVINAHVEICRLMKENDIPVVCLKGYASAYYYPKAHLRTLGDVDFYIEDDYRDKARELLINNGYKEISLDRHHDWLYKKDGVSYEMHFAISGVPSGKDGDAFNEELKDIVKDRQIINDDMGEIAIPSLYHHGLIILLHTASHLMSGGLGLRHLCDWACFVDHFKDDEFKRLFKEKFEKLKIWRFAQILTATCEKYLKTRKHNWVVNINEEAVDKLMNEFLSSGDYSSFQESRQSDLMASEGFSVRVGNRSGIGNMMMVLKNATESHWPITKKNKPLLFFGMVYYTIRYSIRILLGKREKLNIIKLSKEADERRELYKEFGLGDTDGGIHDYELLALIKESLWNDTIKEDVSKDIIDEAKAQSIYGLIGDKKVEIQQFGLFILYCHKEKELIDLFNKNNIPMAVIKGNSAAVYYPKPYLRSMGDYDFIVSPDNFYKAWDLLEDNGYETKASRDINPTRDIMFTKDGKEYELHYKFSDYNINIDKYIEDGLNAIEIKSIRDHDFPMLPPLANGLVLLAHIAHHLHLGLGIRQIIDWMMYCDKVLDDEFWNSQFREAVDDAGLTTLAITVTALCQKYLGLKQTICWCDSADEELVDELFETLMISGNFGHKQGRGNNVQTTIANFKKEGVFTYLQKAGESNWKFYHKHKWVKPFCWFYQIFRFIKQGLHRGSKLKEDINLGKKRYELLKKLDLA